MDVETLCNTIKNAHDIVRQGLSKSENAYIQAYMIGMSTALRLTFKLIRNEIDEQDFLITIEKYSNCNEPMEVPI